MKSRSAMLTALFALFASLVFAQSAQVTITKNVVYATHDGMPLKGDLYLPSAAGPHPALMLIHGGAWKLGTKDGYGMSWGPYLAERGYAVFAIDYRLSTAAQPSWPQALLDCKAALQYLRGNAAELGIDPDRIGVGGDSAGGELSSMLTLTQDWPKFANRYPDDRFSKVSTKVKVEIPAYAVFSMPAWWAWTKEGFKPGEAEHMSLEELFGGTPTEARASYYEASPVNYVRDGAASLGRVALPNAGLKVPWFVTWGMEDPVVPAEGQSLVFVKALQEAGVDVTTAPVPGVGHFWFSKSALTGKSGAPLGCEVKPVNIVVCSGATPNDFISAKLLDFLKNNL
jgi:acetyl esterase/lipase